MLIHNSKENRDRKHEGTDTFVCWRCHKIKPVFSNPESTFAPEYGVDPTMSKLSPTFDLTCWQCCGEIDKETMVRDGRIVLYLVEGKPGDKISTDPYHHEVTNWPGTIRFQVFNISEGRHNLAGTRTDVHWSR